MKRDLDAEYRQAYYAGIPAVVAWLKTVDPSYICHLRDIRDERIPRFNWEILAEIATTNVSVLDDFERDEISAEVYAWATIATIVYEGLAGHALKHWEKRRFLRKELLMRGGLISRFGHTPDDIVLDVNTLIRRSLEDFDYEEASQNVEYWRKKYGVEEFYPPDYMEESDRPIWEQFANIGESLWPVRIAASSGRWKPEDAIKAWLALEKFFNTYHI